MSGGARRAWSLVSGLVSVHPVATSWVATVTLGTAIWWIATGGLS